MTVYPRVDEVLATRARLISKFGGSPGVRDLAALEAAIARPQIGYYQDVIQEAAALWESLSQNHPFVDGNKRVAVTVAAAFLKVNGYQVNFDDLIAYGFLIGLYESGGMKLSNLRRGCVRTLRRTESL